MLVAYRDHEFIPADQAKHGEVADCPYCGRMVILKKDRWGRRWEHIRPARLCPYNNGPEKMTDYIDYLEFYNGELEDEIRELEAEINTLQGA